MARPERRELMADLVGERLTELAGPLPYGFVADDDAADGQHLLDQRRLSGKRKERQMAWLMISGGNRRPA
jgi:hypothetical protein